MPSAHRFTRRASLVTGLAALLAMPSVLAAERVQVVASFSILADMVEQVGGEHVDVTSLVGANGDAHVYSPRPDDARQLTEADLVVFNGMHFEGWMERLLESGDYAGTRVVATDGISGPGAAESAEDGSQAANDHGDHAEHDHSGHDHGGEDPHAWLDPVLGKTYVENIRDGLIEADPAHEEAYRQRAETYLAELEALDADIRDQMAALPDTTSVITGHDSFSYFAQAYDVEFLSPAGLTTASEPSAAHMAELIDVIKANNVQALFHENMTSPAIIDQLAEETGRPVAGTLYSGALSDEGEASTYIGMLRHNARVLHEALAGAEPSSDASQNDDHGHEHGEHHDHGHEHDEAHDHAH
ncbi:metal ABC transporter solute-binding protein, Zn/Mn family [Halomonas halmophila]|uniref:ABC transporter substrate-binding protein n=1 Tax=Halomonas halmophila TaxID=252 RepID=A0A4Y4F9G5_9GAMM|nr:zinc ABC transporter substrate-binding protein [Halomonas halmophila]GED23791.1 ABC transporter substrate-binding protein [Halomonas halmophila]